MKVTISVGGPFPTAYRLAEYLGQLGCLDRIISPMPRFRLRAYRLRNNCLVTLPWLGCFNYGFSRLPYLRGISSRQYWFSELFDKEAGRRLGDCSLFNGWCSVALHSIREAKRRGAVTVLQTGSAHIEFQKKLLQNEYAKFGLRGSITDPRVVVRGVQEYQEADHIVVSSSFAFRSMVQQGIPPSKVSIVNEALTRAFEAQPKQDKVFRIIYVGRVEIRKGVQYLLEAVRRLHLPNSELLMVGSVQEEIMPLLKQYNGCFRSIGGVPHRDLDLYYSQSSLFVLPSVEDGWGHVTLEAMSCGLPVIVSANAGSADIVRESVNGFVVPARDTEALAEKIDFFYRNPDMRQMMGQCAMSSVKQYTWQIYAEHVHSIFCSLLKPTCG